MQHTDSPAPAPAPALATGTAPAMVTTTFPATMTSPAMVTATATATVTASSTATAATTAPAPAMVTATVPPAATASVAAGGTFPSPEPDSFYPVAEHVPDWTDFLDPDDDDLAPAMEEDDPSWTRLPDPDEDAPRTLLSEPDTLLPGEPVKAEPFKTEPSSNPDSVLHREPVESEPFKSEPFPNPDSVLSRKPAKPEPFPDPDRPLTREPVKPEPFPDADEDVDLDMFADANKLPSREPVEPEPFPDPDRPLPRKPVKPEPFPDPDRLPPREPVGAEWDSPEHLVGRRAANGLGQIFDRIGDEYEANIALMAPPWPGLRAGMAGGFMPGHVTVLAGPPGVSKSYFALNILVNISGKGIRWRLLPLEDDAQTWVMKMLAVLEKDWRIVAQPDMDNDDERILNADVKKDAVEKNLIIIRDLFETRIAENPRNPIRTAMGMVVPDVTWTDVLDYVQREGEAGARMICIDPMSQINFGGGGQEYRNQEQFVSRLVAAAAGFGVHVLLVAHTVKQARHLGVADTLEGIQGSAMLTRLAHNVLVLSRQNDQDSLLADGGTVRHRLTLGLPKCRNGFSGTRYAFDLAPGGPCFIEHGVIQ